MTPINSRDVDFTHCTYLNEKGSVATGFVKSHTNALRTALPCAVSIATTPSFKHIAVNAIYESRRTDVVSLYHPAPPRQAQEHSRKSFREDTSTRDAGWSNTGRFAGLHFIGIYQSRSLTLRLAV